jgi:peptide/nickel transport system substrate-binding protein
MLLVVMIAGVVACGSDEPAAAPQPTAVSAESIAMMVGDAVKGAMPTDTGASAGDIQKMIDSAMMGMDTGASAADIQRMISNQMGEQMNASDVRAVVEAAIAAMPAPQVDAAAVRPLVEQAVAASVPEGVSADQIARLVEAAVSGATADVPTRGDLVKSIESAITEQMGSQLTAADVQRIVDASVMVAVEESKKATEAAQGAAMAAEGAAMDAQKALAAVQAPPVAPPSADSVLRVGNSGEVGFLDAAKSQSGTDIIYSEMMYNRLLQYDATMMNPKPDVASSWTVSDDGLTYVFTLRQDVTFHNGKGVTAHDVVYSWNRCQFEIIDRGRCRGELNDVVSYEATGDYEFTVVLDKPSPVFLASMAHWSLAIVDEGSTDQQDTNPVGTGPYTFVEQVPGDRLVLEKYDDYFDKDILNIRPQKVIIIPIKDPQTRMAAVRTGEIDFAVDVPLEQVASLATTEGVQLLQQRDGITASYMTVIFNYREGPMADLRVRKAVGLAIDRDAINRAIFFGLGVPSCNPILESHWAYLPFECADRDVEQAKALLAEAGYGPDNPLKIKYYPENIPVTQKMAEVIQQNLADAGIEMEIVIVDSPTWLDKVWFGVDCDTGDWPESRCWAGKHKEFDLGDAWYTREPDPDGLMQSVFRADSAREGFKGNNGMRYYNPEIERLFDEAKSTTDRNFRAENYRKIVDIVVNQDVPLIKLQSMPRFFAARDVVEGGYVSPKGYWNAKDWSWQEPSDE